MSTPASQETRILKRADLEMIRDQYPFELVDPDSLLEAFDAFESPTARVCRRIGYDASGELVVDISDEEYLSVLGCVEAGMRQVIPHDPRSKYSVPRILGRFRAVREFAENDQSFHNHIRRLGELVEEPEVGKHLYIYGVAMGVKIRQGIRKHEQEAQAAA